MDHPDQVFTHYVSRYVPIVLRGVILAGLLAAMMSTFDSAINSMSTVTVNDFYRRYFVRDSSEQHYVTSSRYFTLGGISVLVSFAVAYLASLPSAPEQLSPTTRRCSPGTRSRRCCKSRPRPFLSHCRFPTGRRLFHHR